MGWVTSFFFRIQKALFERNSEYKKITSLISRENYARVEKTTKGDF